jgi:hypothetical protein
MLKSNRAGSTKQDPAYAPEDPPASHLRLPWDVMSRPRRLEGFNYVGRYRYFLTFCTRDRLPVFEEGEIAEQTLAQFRRTSTLERFAILAYCLMPDHAHLLVEGLRIDSDFRRFAKMASNDPVVRTHDRGMSDCGRRATTSKSFDKRKTHKPSRGT